VPDGIGVSHRRGRRATAAEAPSSSSAAAPGSGTVTQLLFAPAIPTPWMWAEAGRETLPPVLVKAKLLAVRAAMPPRVYVTDSVAPKRLAGGELSNVSCRSKREPPPAEKALAPVSTTASAKVPIFVGAENVSRAGSSAGSRLNRTRVRCDPSRRPSPI